VLGTIQHLEFLEIMSKERHVKSVIEKYGYGSVTKECLDILTKAFWRDVTTFNQLPYIGIAYVDWDDRYACNDLIYHIEELFVGDTNLIKLKVIQVGDDKFSIVHYDDHHHESAIMTAKTDEYVLVGNVIKSKSYHEKEKN